MKFDLYCLCCSRSFPFLYTQYPTAPRDFCLIRYWRDNFDGSYVICLDSTLHPECPLVEGYVRGELHAAYIVAPPRVKVAGAYGGHVAKVVCVLCRCFELSRVCAPFSIN